MFERIFPNQFSTEFFDLAFIELNWSNEQIDELITALESEIPNDFQETTEDLNTSSDFNGWSVHDVATAALYANIHINLPGFERPGRKQLVQDVDSVPRSKFHEYLHKYRPIGWSNYDMDDISAELKKLFGVDDS